jgi:hypothetical protein
MLQLLESMALIVLCCQEGIWASMIVIMHSTYMLVYKEQLVSTQQPAIDCRFRMQIWRRKSLELLL